MLPDLDLLVGMHSGPTHSVGAVAIIGVVAWLIARGAPGAWQGLTPFALACAYASHILLDWIGEDTSSPYGVMALWPFSRDHFMSPVAVMPSITRRYWLPGFLEQNLRALLFELALLVPIVVLVWWGRQRRAARRPGPDQPVV
jgi:inner membrane protein